MLEVDTVAVLTRLTPIGTLTRIVSVALVPTASVPRFPVTVFPDREQLPDDAVHDTKETPAGMESITVTLFADAPPAFFTVMT